MLSILISSGNSSLNAAKLLGLSSYTDPSQSTYFVAEVMMDLVNWILSVLGLENHHSLFIWLYSIAVFGVAFVVGCIIKWITVQILHHVGPHIKSDYYHNLISRKFFTKTGRIIPALLFIILIQFTLFSQQSLASWLTRISWIYVVIILCSSITILADVTWMQIDNRSNKKHLPLNGVVQLIKMILWILSGIIILAILVNKSPGSLLAGLGAFSAVLMLIFKDNILGVVAGVQLAENDSLHEGDWIVPNGSNANGVVVGVGLTAIKIENWDKTISTIPPYSLISNGFKNYRNMQQSQTRQIQRSYLIDADSVVPIDDAMLQKFQEIPFMKDWITKKIEQKNNGKVQDINNDEGLADGSLDSNLGIFRAYLKMWLDSNPNVSHNDTCFVNTLQQTSTGIPLQVYCFTSTSAWVPYEGIQSSIFEHIAVMLYRFNLYVYEEESGRDTIIDGYLSPGKNFDSIFGIPYPFIKQSDVSAKDSNDPAVQPNATA